MKTPFSAFPANIQKQAAAGSPSAVPAAKYFFLRRMPCNISVRRTHIIYHFIIKKEAVMKRMIGFILFWVAVGMTIMLFISSGLFAIILIISFFVLSYHLFSEC